MSFLIVNKSIFDIQADAYCNSINSCGIMGTGVALEFKKRYPQMFDDYKIKCQENKIKPGDCYVYRDEQTKVYILGLAVKKSWKYWSTKDWIEMSLKSLKLVILENDIKSVNIPLLGGMNGRRGPFGEVPNMEPPPERKELKELIRKELELFSNKFNINIKLCIPELVIKKPEFDLTQFLEV